MSLSNYVVICRPIKVTILDILCYHNNSKGESEMKEQMHIVKLCYKDLVNIINLFKGNKVVINEQIDLLIYSLEQLKIKH